MSVKKNIKNLSLSELETVFQDLGLEGYRARQVRQWLYEKDAKDFSEMTNISKPYREKLAELFEIPRLEVVHEQVSTDGTRKFLLRLKTGDLIECVWIPSENRATLCVSSQVGCGMACDFCLTGEMGLKRNLEIYEILEQIGTVKRSLPEGERITNLVFMGMGEPLANTKSLYPALEILIHPECFNFSRHHITVSTSGLAPQIEQFGDHTPVKLAVSLNATTDEVRDVVMPVNKKFNIDKLLQACNDMKLHSRNKITFEYVMLSGINDTLDDAKRLVKLLNRVNAKINLLPFNEYPGSPYKRPSDDWVMQFQKYLLDRGFVAVVRRSRGRDILGACGQLATHHNVKSQEVKPSIWS